MSKQTVAITATQMTEADCQFISIVTRGANRSPFKIFKSDGDNPMNLNLAALFRKQKSDAVVAPTIVAALIRKSADNEEIRAALKCNGVDTSVVTVKKADNGDINQYGTIDGDGESVIRVSGDVMLVMKGIDWSSIPTTFNDYMAVNVSSSISNACYTLQDLLWEIVYESEDKTSLMANAGKAVDDFAAYIKEALGKIPETVIKLEKDLRDAQLAVVAKTEGAPVTEPVATPAPVVAEVAPVVEAAPVAAPATEPVVTAAEPEVITKADIASIVAAALQPFAAKVESMGTTLATVAKLEQHVAKTESALQVVGNLAKSTHDAVSGSVVIPVAGDAEAPVSVSKAEDEVSDTAYATNRKARI